MGRRVKRGYAAALLLFVGAFVLTLAVFSLTACEPMGIRGVVEDLVRGEGDGLTPDTTPPVVESTTPADGATGVERRAEVTVTFSEAMDETTITADTFTMHDASAGAVSGTVSYNSETHTATFTADSALPLLAFYTATIGQGIADSAGNNLDADYLVGFTIRDGVWSGALEVNDGSGGSDPDVAMDTAGNGMIVWDQSNILARRFDAVNGLAPLSEIEGIGTSAAAKMFPDIAFGGSGDAVAVWMEDVEGNKSVISNMFKSVSGWGSEIPVYGPVSTWDTTPDPLSIDSGDAGFFHAVWQVDSENNIYADRHDGSAWLGSNDLNAAAPTSFNIPRIAVSDDGTAMVVYFQDNRIDYNLYDASWSADAAVVDPVSVLKDDPEIAMDRNGRALVVWGEAHGATDYLYYRYYNGSNWGPTWTEIAATAPGDSYLPKVGVDDNGGAIVIYRQSSQLWAQHINMNTGDKVGSAVELCPGGNTVDYTLLTVDPAGNAVVVWGQNAYSIWANRYNRDLNKWEGDTKIHEGAPPMSTLHAGISDAGTAIIVWQYDPYIYAMVFE